MVIQTKQTWRRAKRFRRSRSRAEYLSQLSKRPRNNSAGGRSSEHYLKSLLYRRTSTWPSRISNRRSTKAKSRSLLFTRYSNSTIKGQSTMTRLINLNKLKIIGLRSSIFSFVLMSCKYSKKFQAIIQTASSLRGGGHLPTSPGRACLTMTTY